MSSSSSSSSAKNKYHSGGLAPGKRKVIPSKMTVGSSALTKAPKRNYGTGGKGIQKSKFSK